MAHDTWLSSRERTVQAGERIDLDATSAHRFPIAESAPAAARIDHASCRQQGAEFALVPGVRGAKTLRLSVRPTGAGALVCRLDLAPKDTDLQEATVERYLAEIAAPEQVREAWAASPAPRRWHEVYSKHAKVIVPGAASEAVVTTPMGAILEFVPETDLSTGRPLKDALRARLLLNGAALAGQAVELVDGRQSRGTWRTTDAEGRVDFAAPGPGRWQLRATALRATDVAAGDWASHFATLVFEVLPDAK